MDQPKTCITLLSPIYDNIGQLFVVVATLASVSMTNMAGSKHGIILSSNHTKLNAWSKETNTHVKENEYTSRVGNSAKKRFCLPCQEGPGKKDLAPKCLYFRENTFSEWPRYKGMQEVIKLSSLLIWQKSFPVYR